MTSAKKLGLALAVVAAALMLPLTACEKQGVDRQVQMTIAPPNAPADPANPYAAEGKHMSPVECSPCHFPVYNKIREHGAGHKIDCVRCHTEYHVFNPRKQNYDEIMPKCGGCHAAADGGAFHGPDPALAPCLECHTDAHRPLAIPMERIEARCGACHPAESKEIADHPSKHSEAVACADCHAETHGHVPECSTCHVSHSPEVKMGTSECTTCHPVHSPRRIEYPETSDSLVCKGCHEAPYELLTHKKTKHSGVGCAECHPKHTEIDPCSKCHGQPHSSAMMQDTTKCNQCHGIAHDLAAE